jgi:hypothetical protein
MACAQSDAALFNRLCPAGKGGVRSFAPVMLKRLKKLGITETDPEKLTTEERSKWVPLPCPTSPSLDLAICSASYSACHESLELYQ